MLRSDLETNVGVYIDNAGSVNISPRYAAAERFPEGLAPLVRLGGKTGYMKLHLIVEHTPETGLLISVARDLPFEVTSRQHRTRKSFPSILPVDAG